MNAAPKASIKSLGEIALRVNDLDSMQDFYQNKIGLELIKRFESSVFLKICDGYAGHTTILALFDRSADLPDLKVSRENSTLDHLAFTISLDDYQSELDRLKSLGLEVTTTTHPWVKWRSMYVKDPEGNNVELVCYDESVE